MTDEQFREIMEAIKSLRLEAEKLVLENARLKAQLADALKVTTEATIEHVKGKQR